MKRSFAGILIFFLVLFSLVFAVKKLGAWYVVKREKSPYSAVLGDKQIKQLPQGTLLRLIKDESIAETAIRFPMRVIKIMLTIKPRGNWLMEDEAGNRGYMWSSDLDLLNN